MWRSDPYSCARSAYFPNAVEADHGMRKETRLRSPGWAKRREAGHVPSRGLKERRDANAEAVPRCWRDSSLLSSLIPCCIPGRPRERSPSPMPQRRDDACTTPSPLQRGANLNCESATVPASETAPDQESEAARAAAAIRFPACRSVLWDSEVRTCHPDAAPMLRWPQHCCGHVGDGRTLIHWTCTTHAHHHSGAEDCAGAAMVHESASP